MLHIRDVSIRMKNFSIEQMKKVEGFLKNKKNKKKDQAAIVI